MINPPTDIEPRDRISLVYFHLPNHDTILGGIGSEPAESDDALTFTDHYFGIMVRTAKTEGGGSSVTANDLVAGETT